jgi:hypothetical protein
LQREQAIPERLLERRCRGKHQKQRDDHRNWGHFTV